MISQIHEIIKELNKASGKEEYKIDSAYGPGTSFDNGTYYFIMRRMGEIIFKETHKGPFSTELQYHFDRRILVKILTAGIVKLSEMRTQNPLH